MMPMSNYDFKRGIEYSALLNVGKPEEEIMELYGIDPIMAF